MAELQSLEELGGAVDTAAPEAPVHVQKLDAQPTAVVRTRALRVRKTGRTRHVSDTAS